MWSGGVVINLGTSMRVDRGTAINNRGQIIGFDRVGGPFLWDNGVLSELPGLTSASDINDRGQILGLSDGRPVVWTYGMMTPLALPPGEWQVATAAINKLGHAVGTITSTAAGAVSMAVLWRNGEVIPLPGLVANEPTAACDINNRDEIVGSPGSQAAPAPDRHRKASLWVPQTPPTTTSLTGRPTSSPSARQRTPPIDLGTLGGTYSTPTGINDNGVVVGSSTTAAKEQHAFVWTPTNGMVDLGTFGDRSAPGWPLRTSFATAVSNTGQVVGASYVPGDQWRRTAIEPSCGLRPPACRIIGTPTVFLQLCHRNQRCGTGCRQQRWFATCCRGHRRADGWTSARSVGPCGRWPSTTSARSSAPAASEPARSLPQACVPVDGERRHGGPWHAGRAVECGRGREPERPGRRVGADRRRLVRHELARLSVDGG